MTGHHCWGYGEDDGPSEWHRYYPIAQGNRQSPINIISSQAVFNRNLNPLVLSYDHCTSVNISNNGHSVVVEFEDCNDKTVISGGPLSDSYRLKQFHFHWGTQEGQGSEHTVDGKSYPCELHLVHWNAKAYATFEDAAAASDGLAVIGIFLDHGGQHPGLNRLTDALYMVKFKGTKAQFDNFNPKCLLPPGLEYWTYPGSLTTPPLNESVIWIVLKEPIKVSEKQAAPIHLCVLLAKAANHRVLLAALTNHLVLPAVLTNHRIMLATLANHCDERAELANHRIWQMDKFRKTLLFSGEEEDERIQMVNNFRPPQPLNGRKVQASFKG